MIQKDIINLFVKNCTHSNKYQNMLNEKLKG